jgi:hypothetical protein
MQLQIIQVNSKQEAANIDGPVGIKLGNRQPEYNSTTLKGSNLSKTLGLLVSTSFPSENLQL